MATPPQPPPKPAPPHQPPPLKDPAAGTPPAIIGGQVIRPEDEPGRPQVTIGVSGKPIEDGERDPDTIAEEQRRRSAEMEKEGVFAWMDRHDSRTPEERTVAQAAVEGVHAKIEATKKIA